MTVTRRTGFGIAAAAIAALTLTLAGLHAQNTSGGQGPFMGRGGPRGGPGGIGRLGGPGGRGGPLGALGPIARLDLTEAQRQEIRSLVESRQAETKAIMDRARPAHDALHAAVTADTYDEGTIRSLHAEVAAVEAEMILARARLHADVLRLLTPEQRTQLKALQDRMKERAGERRQPRENRG